MLTTAIFVALGCTVANYGYQAVYDRDWSRAAERSFFQIAAIVAMIGANSIGK